MTRRSDVLAALARVALLAVVGVGFETVAAAAPDRGTAQPKAEVRARADALYNAGTGALARGEVGPAVAFLAAAERLEPRAKDIRINLERATAAAAHARGLESTDEAGLPRGLPLSTTELAWIGAILLALGAAGGIGARLVRPGRRVRAVARASLAAVLAGALLSAWLLVRARSEAAHPEAVVVTRQLAVERGPDEPSRAPVILGAGERVRLGAQRGGQVEIRVAGTPIGWAPREGLWRVSETPRYTATYATP